MKSLRRTKIVGTIGPASENRLEELFDAGLNVCRINYSHGSWDEQSEKSLRIVELRDKLDLPIALLLDMKGPEIRTGMLYTGKNTKIQLKDGQKFTLVNDDITGDEEKVSVTYKELYKDVQPGTKILIDDRSPRGSLPGRGNDALVPFFLPDRYRQCHPGSNVPDLCFAGSGDTRWQNGGLHPARG